MRAGVAAIADMAPWMSQTNKNAKRETNSMEYMGYKVSQSAPKMSALANLVRMSVPRLIALNSDLFSGELMASTKIPKHTVIRISETEVYDKFESLREEVKAHTNTYRACDMGDQNRQWEVLEVTDK